LKGTIMSFNDFIEGCKLMDEHLSDGHVSGNKSEQVVSDAERLLGVKFPKSYREFLKQYGCGGIAGFAVLGCRLLVFLTPFG
jgi:hypothetical protein